VTPRRPPPRPVEAVVLDLDGVLVDTEPVHLSSSRALVAPGVISDADYARFIGTGGFKEWIEETYGVPAAEFTTRYSALFYAELEAAPLVPFEGVRALLEALSERGIPAAVASQSSRDWVEATLQSAGLLEALPCFVSAEEVARGKPAPDVYLRAAERLGVDPSRCIAVEDSVHGIASAVAAGMWVVQSTQASITPPPQPNAYAVIASLASFDIGWLGAR
jgi:HAD superfamily hydrolase (TIGR01509 family)